jgi:hypothetical protein
MQDDSPMDANRELVDAYESEEDDWDDEPADDVHAGAEDEHHEEADQGASEADLRRAWEHAKEAVRMLEGNPRSPPSLLAAARRQRDAAEAAWRAAKPPHPLHKRLRWAQRAYDSAAGKQRVHQDELDKFDEDTARRRKQLVERCQADRIRTAKRLSELEALLAQGGQRQPPASVRAVRICATGIDTDVGPALAAVADKLEEGSPAWLELQAAMASLATVEEQLRNAAVQDHQSDPILQAPAQFDISDAAAADIDAGGVSLGGGPSSPLVSTSDAGRTAAAPPAAGPVPTPKWVGPQSGTNRWGGREWRKVEPTAPTSAAADARYACDSSMAAKEQASKLLADQRARLEAAQARERSSAEAARAHEDELARLQQMQVEQRRRAEADAQAAAAAAETLRATRQAVAEAEAAEAARLEQEKLLLISRTLPEDLQRAQEVHAQQAIIIQQQQHQQLLQQQQIGAGATAAEVRGDASTGIDADAERLMAMSEDELRRWHEDTQQGNW